MKLQIWRYNTRTTHVLHVSSLRAEEIWRLHGWRMDSSKLTQPSLFPSYPCLQKHQVPSSLGITHLIMSSDNKISCFVIQGLGFRTFITLRFRSEISCSMDWSRSSICFKPSRAKDWSISLPCWEIPATCLLPPNIQTNCEEKNIHCCNPVYELPIREKTTHCDKMLQTTTNTESKEKRKIKIRIHYCIIPAVC